MRHYRRALGLLATAILVAATAPAAAIDLDNFGGPVTITGYTSLDQIPQGGQAHVAIALEMKFPWHINAHHLTDEFLVPTEVAFTAPEGITIHDVVYPAGHEKKLDFAEEPMMLYEGTVYIGAVVEVAPDVPLGKTSITAAVTYQACDNEKCLLPEEETVFIPVVISAPHEAVDLTHGEIFEQIDFAAVSGAGADEGGVMGAIADKGLWFGFILVFFGGLALNLTPCVFPMIPITVSYFGGQGRGSQGKTVTLAILYLLGMATMYSSLGLVAAFTGSLFGSALQNPFVLIAIALVMFVLAASMFGLYEIRVPMRLAGVAGTAKQGYFGSFLMGATVGIVAAPCIGPFVLGLLTFVGESGNPVLGFGMFFTLALGLGLPFVFLAVASGNLSKLPKSGEWMEWVRRLFGVVLIGMGVFFLRPLLGDPLYFGILGGLLVFGGVILGFVLKVKSTALFFNAFRRFVGVAAPLYGLYLILTPGNIIAHDGGHGIAWQPYDVGVLASAAETGKPVVIDFSADWCLPCKELEHKTFNQPEVIDAAKGFVPLRADLTRSSSPEVKDLRARYQIRGVPTIVFIDETGKERKDLRVVQFIDKDEFLRRVRDLNG